MIQMALQLRYTRHALRPVAGWLVNSSDPRDWLEEAIRCCVANSGQPAVEQSQLRFLPIPQSRDQRQPCGAVMIADRSATAPTAKLCPSARCLAYGRIGDRLFLPVESRLEPAVSEEELRDLLSERLTYVWHPIAGLVALEADEIRSIADLIHVGPPQRRPWDRAQIGQRLPSRLHSLAPLDPPTIELVTQMGQDDIGSQSDGLAQLPPTTDEPRPGIGNSLKRAGLNVLAGGFAGVTSAIERIGMGRGANPAGAGSDMPDDPAWLDRLKQWTQQRLEHLNQALLSAREKELNRLMHLLETDPDQGLKYALPVGGDAHRGMASPSSHLSERNPDFSLGRLGGGQAADSWDMSWQGRQRLIARYRQLANREMQLGRYRRAAYIYGELLADFQAAAGALKQGKHWREAAVLYRLRVKRPLEAAECLEQGGLWTEAAELYVELEEHEKAGDVLTRLQQPEGARQQYRLAVDQCRAHHDQLGAARLLEDKLGAVDEAIEELSDAWPHSQQAVLCLRTLFAVFGRLGRHDAARGKIQQLRASQHPQPSHLPLIETLAENAANYPDRTVRTVAADSTRLLASQMLVGGQDTECSRIINAVRRLAPQDRLLGRDCLRFERRRVANVPSTKPKTRTRGNHPALVRSIHLPCPIGSWKAEAAIAAGGAVFVAARTSSGVLEVYRFRWTGQPEPRLTWLETASAAELVLAANPNRADWLLVHPAGGPLAIPVKTFPETGDCPYQTKVGAVPGMTPGLLSASATGHGITWTMDQRNGLPTLTALTHDGHAGYGQTLHQWHDELIPYMNESRRVPMHAAGHFVYLGVQDKLISFDRAKFTSTVELGHPITSIVGSAPNTRSRIAVGFDQGGIVFWDDNADGRWQRFGNDLREPLVVFNRGGLLIAAHDRAGEVYSTDGGQVNLQAELDLPFAAVAVVSAVRPDQFGVLFETGLLHLYQMA